MSGARSQTLIKGFAVIWDQLVDEVTRSQAATRRHLQLGSQMRPPTIEADLEGPRALSELIGQRTGIVVWFAAEPGGLCDLFAGRPFWPGACRTWKHPVRA